ncbi:NUDIX hydrolase [Exiguobacterium sp. Helios]|uniref:NUDIX hydrolase n=1 Tax=Exiguobacterium sp. Helios TaxID=2735868 RepID=UPI00165E27E5|nr:NUDIX hydrolase [Exiguobacterium sp. Helios]QNR20793.1 NUDIX hydrolase [Exiguobacterium sp. Helios]
MDIKFTVGQQRFNHRAAAVIVKEGHLLIHRNVRDDFWALPGGRIRLMESGAEAVIREIKEELGLAAEVSRFLSVHENFFTYDEISFHEVGFYYEVTVLHEMTVMTEEFFGVEGQELMYRFIPLEELSTVTLYPVQLQTMIEAGKWDRLFRDNEKTS